MATMKESKPNVYQFPQLCPYLSIMVRPRVCPPPDSMHGGRRRWPRRRRRAFGVEPTSCIAKCEAAAPGSLEERQADTAGPSERRSHVLPRQIQDDEVAPDSLERVKFISAVFAEDAPRKIFVNAN